MEHSLLDPVPIIFGSPPSLLPNLSLSYIFRPIRIFLHLCSLPPVSRVLFLPLAIFSPSSSSVPRTCLSPNSRLLASFFCWIRPLSIANFSVPLIIVGTGNPPPEPEPDHLILWTRSSHYRKNVLKYLQSVLAVKFNLPRSAASIYF